MTSTLMVIQIILAIVITIAILLQKSSSIGLGAYSSSNESLFGAKGPMGFLAKFTFGMALLFVINTLALGYYYSQESAASVVDNASTKKASKTITIPAPTNKKATSTPAATPKAPVAPTKSDK